MQLTLKQPPVCALGKPGKGVAESEDIIHSALSSPPVEAMRCVLARGGDLVIDPEPIIYKRLSDTYVRLMFPVTGGRVEAGAVVSVVCLYDHQTGETLYAHAMHAGPGVNPLLKHLDGPMASPKAQPGDDGNRATLRIQDHKRALWERFLRELPKLGEEEAGRHWRDSYYWSLRRLYFCTRCKACKWGSPFFDGPDPELPRKDTVAALTESAQRLTEAHATVVRDILASDTWRVEVAYAQRGGFEVDENARLVKDLDEEFVEVLFPTNAVLLQAGSLVGVAMVYHRPSRSVVLGHCISAGPDAEIQFLKSDVAFAIPGPQPGSAGIAAKADYVTWRAEAWSQFWLDELDGGLTQASAAWLHAFWAAITQLFGRNDLDSESRHGNQAEADLIDPAWYFREFLPLSFPQSSVTRMTALSTTMRFVITGNCERQWACRFDKGRLAGVSEGINGCAEDFGYRMSPEAFSTIVTGRATLQELFFRGEGDMFGDVEQALKMVPILREFIKEFPAVLS